MKGFLLTTGLTAILAVTGCGNPQITEFYDVTRDGISDITLKFRGSEWLFIGKSGGNFEQGICVKECLSERYLKSFKTQDGTVYIYNKNYDGSRVAYLKKTD